VLEVEMASAGHTHSSNFPTTPTAFDASFGGPADSVDGFIAAIDTTRAGLASLLCGSYIGGNGEDAVWGLQVDPEGCVYVTGTTRSTDLPATPTAVQIMESHTVMRQR
jgi:hypothetical protein